MTPALAVALALAAAPAAGAAPCGLPPRAGGPLPFASGETLSYDLDLLGMVRGGTVELSVERPTSGGKILPLRARARTDPSLGAVARITAVAFSWVDARTLAPERYREQADENGVQKLGDARFPRSGEVTIRYELGERVSTSSHAREAEALDALSAVYRLRAARLAPGDRICLDLVARGAYWRVRAQVAARPEKVETALGRLETIRIDARAHRDREPASKARDIHLWFTTDERRLLVAAVGEVDAGPVRMMITGARRPAR